MLVFSQIFKYFASSIYLDNLLFTRYMKVWKIKINYNIQ